MERMSGTDFVIDKRLGEGCFGDVHSARCVKDGSFVALKRLWKTNQKANQDIRASFQQEIQCGHLLSNHAGIARILGYFESSRHYWLVMELVDGVELLTLMENRQYTPLPEPLVKYIFAQVVSALAYAHRQGVAHLDIKLDNVMVTPSGFCKIIDWGLSTNDDPKHCYKLCGSLEYTAPEIFNRPSIQSFYNAFIADSFSMGVLLYTMLFGKFPFSKEVLQMMRRGDPVHLEFPQDDDVSSDAKNALRRLLEPNPRARMTVQELEKDPWLISMTSTRATVAS